MELQHMTPLVVYDDQCYLCTKFAKAVNFFARGKISFVGHYSDIGEEIREKYLDTDALRMFWYIDEKIAYGGRAALFPLIAKILTSKRKQTISKFNEACSSDCKSTKAVFVRSASLLTNSKKIILQKPFNN